MKGLSAAVNIFQGGGPFYFEAPVRLGAVDVFPGVHMGMHSYAVSGVIGSHVKIGRYCSIGRWVTIGAGNHNLENLSPGSPAYRGHSLEAMYEGPDAEWRVVIGNDVWIGDKATILSGITIGTGAVVGANAVITNDVPPYAIVVGTPARVLRYRFDEKTIESLLELAWWEFSDEALAGIDTTNVQECVARLPQQDSNRTLKETVYQEFRPPALVPQSDRIAHLENRLRALEAAVASKD